MSDTPDFTPGPWAIRGENSREGALTVCIVNETGVTKHIAYMAWNKDSAQKAGGPTGGADARLIAAAPELYAMLWKLACAFDDIEINEDDWVVARELQGEASRLLNRIDGDNPAEDGA